MPSQSSGFLQKQVLTFHLFASSFSVYSKKSVTHIPEWVLTRTGGPLTDPGFLVDPSSLLKWRFGPESKWIHPLFFQIFIGNFPFFSFFFLIFNFHFHSCFSQFLILFRRCGLGFVGQGRVSVPLHHISIRSLSLIN